MSYRVSAQIERRVAETWVRVAYMADGEAVTHARVRAERLAREALAAASWPFLTTVTVRRLPNGAAVETLLAVDTGMDDIRELLEIGDTPVVEI